MFAYIYDQCLADSLPALRSPAAARQQRYTFLGGNFHRGSDVLFGLGDDYA